MARGFESKSVQSQWQDAEDERDAKKKQGQQDRDEIERRSRREGLEMSRRRILRELDETSSERRREQLKAALAHLDGELAKLK